MINDNESSARVVERHGDVEWLHYCEPQGQTVGVPKGDACATCGKQEVASNEHVPSDDPFAALKKFYAVTTDAELIAIQEQRIEKLLARLPPMRDTQPGRVREG